MSQLLPLPLFLNLWLFFLSPTHSFLALSPLLSLFLPIFLVPLIFLSHSFRFPYIDLSCSFALLFPYIYLSLSLSFCRSLYLPLLLSFSPSLYVSLLLSPSFLFSIFQSLFVAFPKSPCLSFSMCLVWASLFRSIQIKCYIVLVSFCKQLNQCCPFISSPSSIMYSAFLTNVCSGSLNRLFCSLTINWSTSSKALMRLPHNQRGYF